MIVIKVIGALLGLAFIGGLIQAGREGKLRRYKGTRWLPWQK